MCPLGFFGSDCHEQCSCNSDESCDPITGQCESISTTSTEKSTIFVNTIQLKNNGKFEIDKNGLISTTIISTGIIDNFMSSHVDSDTNRQYFLTTDRPKLSKDDDFDRGDRDDLVNSASAATAISVGVIVVAAVILAANHFRGKGVGKKGVKKEKGVSTVAVYTHSIFHTPLPGKWGLGNQIFTQY